MDFDKDKQLKVYGNKWPQIFLLMHHGHHHYDIQHEHALTSYSILVFVSSLATILQKIQPGFVWRLSLTWVSPGSSAILKDSSHQWYSVYHDVTSGSGFQFWVNLWKPVHPLRRLFGDRRVSISAKGQIRTTAMASMFVLIVSAAAVALGMCKNANI